MKSFLTTILLLSITLIGSAQLHYKRQPGQILNIIPYHIQVSDLATTILMFPFEVKEADMGVSELLATKIPDVKNILKLKAQKPTLDTTSLYVITGDGKVHVFQVTYSPRPLPLAYELLIDESLVTHHDPKITFENQPYSQLSLQQWVEKIKNIPATLNKQIKDYRFTLTLNDIYWVDKFMFFKFTISNKSTLPFSPEWVQLYIKDGRVQKRSAVQELPIDLIYLDSLVEVPGKGAYTFVIGIPRQTPPTSKKMILEVHEENGRRNIQFHILSRYLLKAKPLY